MLRLALDVGNSLIKAGLFNASAELVLRESFSHTQIDQLVDFLSQYELTSAGISAVSSVDSQLYEFLEKHHLSLLDIDAQVKLPFTNRYKSPETLGSDRLASVAGGSSVFGECPYLTVNAGSCITYNLVDEQNCFLGGAISPGIQMRFRAMNQETHQLPAIATFEEIHEIGQDTPNSMITGVLKGLQHEMGGFIDQWSEKFSGLKAVLAGGNANLLKNDQFHHIEPDLNLYGIQKIMEHNDV